MSVFLTDTMPWSSKSRRPSDKPLHSHSVTLLPEGEGPWVISSREPEWVCGHREVLPHLPCQHKIRGDLWHMHFEGDFCSSLMMGASIRYVICFSTLPREGQQAPSEGSCWWDGVGTSHHMHPPSIPLFCTPTTLLHLACAGLVPTHGTATRSHWHTCSLGMQPGHSGIGTFRFRTPLFLFVPPFSPAWGRLQLSSSVSPALGRHRRRPASPRPDSFYYT